MGIGDGGIYVEPLSPSRGQSQGLEDRRSIQFPHDAFKRDDCANTFLRKAYADIVEWVAARDLDLLDSGTSQ